MLDKNSTQDAFRFIQVRPPIPVESGPTVVLPAETPLATQLPPLSGPERTKIATAYVRAHVTEATGIATSQEGRRVADAIQQQAQAGGTVSDFRSLFHLEDGGADPIDAYRKHHGNLANFLIAAKFAAEGVPRETNGLARLFRGFAALVAEHPGELAEVPLARYLRRPIALPDSFGTARKMSSGPAEAPTPPSSPQPKDEINYVKQAAEFHAALQDVTAMVRPDLLQLPGEKGSTTKVVPFALSTAAVDRLAPETRSALSKLGLDPTRQPVTTAIGALEEAVAINARRAARSTGFQSPTRPAPRPHDPLPVTRPYIRTVGIADLLVVKQHLLRYERVDIAHIENVLAGEKKLRTHRNLERTEDTAITERERVQQRETELQTDERFELQREMSATATQDQQFGFQLSLSGKYGPSVEFSSNAELDISNSTEETTSSSTQYAKDILSRSLERITERVRELRQRTVVRELEETNLHELNNSTEEHIIGTYQFVEKVYESQVFNYGIRQMFDFMVPEPASYVWYLENSPATELNLPEAPPRLELVAPNARTLTGENYLYLAATFGAEDISGPPPGFLITTTSLKSGGSGDEGGEPRTVVDKDVLIPEGYTPLMATVWPIALTDDELTIGINVGTSQSVWKPRNPPEVQPVDEENSMAATGLFFNLGDGVARLPQSTLPIQALAFETNTFALTADVIFRRTDTWYEAWQVQTYEALASAYQNTLQKYQQDVAELKAEAAAEAARANPNAPFGAPPSQNLRTVLEELKKHCISIVTRQRYDGITATTDDAPPIFDFDEAADEGSFIRFFEQAFEWDQMQYVFYPYYWSRKHTWADRFERDDVDPVFRDFLRSGVARVVVPTRPGFEVAIAHYLETGLIWDGLGNPPEINSPLYVPIVTEIKERTGASLGEVPVGEPWLTHLPTPLVTLRREANLPEWERQSPDGWEWREKA